MVDDNTMELLSRHLDHDLDDSDENRLAVQIEEDQQLRLELESLKRVRAALREMAATEDPPAALDTILAPLVRSPAPAAGARPWLRWLATAAVVVVGLTVVLEVSRRRSYEPTGNWPARAAERSATETGGRFALAPLPTRAPGVEERPRGAAERLLSADGPEIDVNSSEPAAPLEVLGPLEAPVGETEAAAGEGRDGGREDFGVRGQAKETVTAEPHTDRRLAETGRQSSMDGDGTAEKLDETKADQVEARASSGDESWTEAALFDGQLLVFVEGKTLWRSFKPRVRCDPGRYAVRVRIEAGTVRKVWPVWKPLAAPTESLQASAMVLGLTIDGIADGEYVAEVVVELRPPDHR
jgi:hypothetical protein